MFVILSSLAIRDKGDCRGEDDGCCAEDTPCAEGDGDCDGDEVILTIV